MSVVWRESGRRDSLEHTEGRIPLEGKVPDTGVLRRDDTQKHDDVVLESNYQLGGPIISMCLTWRVRLSLCDVMLSKGNGNPECKVLGITYGL